MSSYDKGSCAGTVLPVNDAGDACPDSARKLTDEIDACPEHARKYSKDHDSARKYDPDHGKKMQQTGLMKDADGMKAATHEELAEVEYDVSMYYHETGWARDLATNEKFGHLTLGVISMNAVWIGVDSDHNDAPDLASAALPFQIGEHFFCIFFTFEWLTRFLAFKRKRDGFKDGWFKFDSVLVGMMVMETWVQPLVMGSVEGGGMGDASMLRLLRLLRLTRMARLFRSVPELLTLLKGMAAATRSVLSTLILLILFTYVFAIIFKQQVGENEDEELAGMFDSITESMWNLLMAGTLLDNCTYVLNLLRTNAPMMTAVFLLWILLSSFTILNMLIGVLCEVVTAVSEAEKEKGVVSYVKSTLLAVLTRLDKDGNGTISEDEFNDFVTDEEAKPAFDELEVDTDNLASLGDVIFAKKEAKAEFVPSSKRNAEGRGSILIPASADELKKSRELSFSELLEMILDLRSTNPAMVRDVVDLGKQLRSNHKETTEMFGELGSMLKRIELRQEEVISQMIVPLATGLREVQEKLNVSTSIPASVSSPCLGDTEAANNPQGDPNAVRPVASPAVGASARRRSVMKSNANPGKVAPFSDKAALGPQEPAARGHGHPFAPASGA